MQHRIKGGNAHVTHRHHVVDLLDAEPVKDVGHERLETHVLDAGDKLGRLEVLVGRVTTTLAQIVNEVPNRNDERRLDRRRR